MDPKTKRFPYGEFIEFLKAEEPPVPPRVTNTILASIHSALNPSGWFVFFKLLGIHCIFGTLSLALCNQFGLNPFQTSFSLSEYFMSFGHSFCMTLCGILFLSGTVVAAKFLFSQEEFQVLRKNKWIHVFLLSSFSLAVFAVVGAHLALEIVLFWIVGTFIGGCIPFLIFANSTPGSSVPRWHTGSLVFFNWACNSPFHAFNVTFSEEALTHSR